MKCLTTILIFVFLGSSRGGELHNSFLLAYYEELENLTPRSNSLSEDVSNEVLFYLYTKEEPNERQQLILNDVDVFQSSFFNPDNPTKIIIHGFLDCSTNPMAQTIKNSLLEQEDVNVILVDWGKIAKGLDYIKIAMETVDIGAFVARFMEFLVENGAQLDDFHLIGHSLGAHIAGFAGAGVTNGTVARITGLDPAMPGFYNAPSDKRLDRSDAKFVDCIHTCAGMLGLTEAICTADFYPNGGKNMQPGCPFYDFGRCSHLRSYEYLNESIIPTHQFPTESCPSPPVRDHSQCEPSSIKMGYYVSTSAKGIFYGVTNSKYPFAVTSDN
ncbi:pancreatic triacylglycerol lipase [Halyomorpha halys]|uniref:pancreatic triacylglycerol lipase n=1 Tax=Halyomorpha halys TaxID=286706 RepID=UPI0006D4C9B2|nr:pancreatic triacylglycerol lipase [Halyomorpha halys]XP_014275646.1 pancreatic triacylglycerol lipase [Halyomorpha halys]